ncbi:holo-ACP synthase [uncultured Propionivibrio sp.]|uniref:holo-ACP synthase n=1 Tax=uncultured Propionivibrio sp. TaxID=426737 RepID=UPI0029BFBBEE|nr:holo-ACP synthase [uncultured Propionivibrio sp.]
MIAGIGTDIVAVSRLGALFERHGERALEKLLAPSERVEFARAKDSARFLAKRFAAKEALGKALGIGVAFPATLPNVAVTHDVLGKPKFDYAPELAKYLAERKLCAHLSISDEAEYALAFVVLERQ